MAANTYGALSMYHSSKHFTCISSSNPNLRGRDYCCTHFTDTGTPDAGVVTCPKSQEVLELGLEPRGLANKQWTCFPFSKCKINKNMHGISEHEAQVTSRAREQQ